MILDKENVYDYFFYRFSVKRDLCSIHPFPTMFYLDIKNNNKNNQDYVLRS